MRDTVAHAIRMVRGNPRQSVLPMAVIQLPVAILSAAVSAVLYLTVFDGEPYEPGGLFAVDLLDGDVSSEQKLALLLTMGVSSIFGMVASGGTIVGVESVHSGKPLGLPQCLDPAFTRLGALIAVHIVLLALVFGLALTIVGLVALPFLLSRLALSPAALLLDDESIPGALSRSWRLTRGSVLRYIGVILLVGLFFIPALLVGALGFIAEDASRNVQILTDTVVAIAQGIILIPAFAIAVAATTLFYLRLEAHHRDTPGPS